MSALIIPLGWGHVALVDEEDWKNLSNRKWHASGEVGRWVARTYIRTDWSTGRRRLIYATMQQLIMGERPGFEIDHRNRNTLDNRRENLRWATPTQNTVNRALPNSTGFKGVYKNGNGYAAKIYSRGAQGICLGTFNTAEEAHEAYRQAAIRVWGEFASFECKPPKRKE